MEVEATSKEEATEKIDLACKKILANPIMESYSCEVFNQA
jgi:phosphoribosylformylglycinamidine (FGAM) synthase PurS component